MYIARVCKEVTISMNKEIKDIKQTTNGTEAPKKVGRNWAKLLGVTFAVVVVLISLFYGFYQVNQAVGQVRANWAEIQFANNPKTHKIVENARLLYQKKEASIAGEILVTEEQKPADKLVETLIDQINPKK